jgi:hypothetical protein
MRRGKHRVLVPIGAKTKQGFERGPARKYHAGDVINDYTLVEITKEEYDTKTHRFVRTWMVECACGRRRTIVSTVIGQLKRCQHCAKHFLTVGHDMKLLRMYQMTTKFAREQQPVGSGWVWMPNYLPDWDGLEGNHSRG